MINEIVSKEILDKKREIATNPLSNNPNKNNIYIAGDSHMNVLARVLKIHPKIEQYNFYQLNSSGCYYIYDFDKIHKYSFEIQEYCSQKTQKNRTCI